MSETNDAFAKVIAPDTVRIERVLPGPIERVWAYLTESEKRGKWFCSGAIEPRVGGKAELIFQHSDLSSEKTYPEKHKDKAGGIRMIAEITRYEPPHALAWVGGPGDGSEVIFELTPRGSDVLLVLTHRRLANRGMVVGVSGGWHAHLGILEDNLNGVEPRPFWTTHAKLDAEYQRRIPAA
jgi:uncharacterized protein YndB with AHSA1/START domain